jgi:hypothetical protein
VCAGALHAPQIADFARIRAGGDGHSAVSPSLLIYLYAHQHLPRRAAVDEQAPQGLAPRTLRQLTPLATYFNFWENFYSKLDRPYSPYEVSQWNAVNS